MVGSTRPLRLEEAAFASKLAEPQSKAALDAMGFSTFAALRGQFNAGPAEIKEFPGRGADPHRRPAAHRFFLALPQNDKPVDMTKLRGDVGPYQIVQTPSVWGEAHCIGGL